MSNKIGFWSVFALVTGSQIGTGVFILPANLAPYGALSIVGWLISGCGAVALALVFASLCSKFPQTGGPHVYVKNVFGFSTAFFTGWTYWVISWISTTAVIVTAVGYLAPFLGNQPSSIYLILEISILLIITALNLKGLKSAGRAEIFLTLLKFMPLLVISLVALCFFDSKNLVVASESSELSTSEVLGKITLITLWGFIGLESATTTAGSVENPTKTIPKAIVLGTFSVAVLYIINSIGIMGLIPAKDLSTSTAPYVDAVQIIFGGQWHFLISLIASIVCIGTLNAWMLASGQISLGLAEDGLMPVFFARRNKNNAPVNGLITCCLGILPLLVLTANKTLANQITAIIDFSVTAFLFVYLICSLALLKLLLTTKDKKSLFQWLYCIIAIVFCVWVIYETPLKTLVIAGLFTLSGLPVYLLSSNFKIRYRRSSNL